MAQLDRKRHVAVQLWALLFGNLRPPQGLHSLEGIRTTGVPFVEFSFSSADQISRCLPYFPYPSFRESVERKVVMYVVPRTADNEVMTPCSPILPSSYGKHTVSQRKPGAMIRLQP